MAYGIQQPEAAPQQEASQAQKTIEFLQTPFAAQFDDPKFRRAAMQYDSALNSGQEMPNFSAEGMYEFANRLFSRELQKGVGSKLPDGSTIESKKIVTARQDGDRIVLELDILARRENGEVYDYRAPVTRDRSSDDTDEVLFIPLSAVRDRVRGARYLAQAIEQAGGREAALQQILSATQEGAADAPAEEQAPEQGGYGVAADAPPPGRFGLDV